MIMEIVEVGQLGVLLGIFIRMSLLKQEVSFIKQLLDITNKRVTKLEEKVA